MIRLTRSWGIGLLMAATATLTWAITSVKAPVAFFGQLKLESAIPLQFGDWRIEPNAYLGLVNAQQAQMLDQIYNQVLTRTYTNRRTGRKAMLSIAYGADQRDNLQLHYPEVCYPAQGFELLSVHSGQLATPWGALPVRRLETRLGRDRPEPVTYWAMVGEHVALGGVQKKLVEMRYGLHGQIVDGLLFRVSSIDDSSASAFALQNGFVTDLLGALSPYDRHRFSGT